MYHLNLLKSDYHLIFPTILPLNQTLRSQEWRKSDNQLKYLLIVKQILLVSTLGNV